MFSWKGLISVLVVGALLAIPIKMYWTFLTEGMRPSESTLTLNRLETVGVPDFTLNDMGGKPVSLSEFKGRIVLVNFWATWCAPCVKEFPSMMNLVRHFKGDVAVLAVSYDKDREDITTFINAFGEVPKDVVIVWDKEKATSKLFGTDVLPETYILGKDQKLIRKIAGEASWDNELALEYFRDLLSK